MLETAVILVLAVAWMLTPLWFHEAGHWIVLRRLNVRVVEHWFGLGPALLRWGRWRVGMLPIGGAVVPDPHAFAALSARQRMWVALAGPLASLLHAAVVLGVWALNQEVTGAEALRTVGLLSLLLAGVNAIPIPPLDGFQAYVNWREIQQKPLEERHLALANRLGSGLVYGVGFWVLGWWMLPG